MNELTNSTTHVGDSEHAALPVCLQFAWYWAERLARRRPDLWLNLIQEARLAFVESSVDESQCKRVPRHAKRLAWKRMQTYYDLALAHGVSRDNRLHGNGPLTDKRTNRRMIRKAPTTTKDQWRQRGAEERRCSTCIAKLPDNKYRQCLVCRAKRSRLTRIERMQKGQERFYATPYEQVIERLGLSMPWRNR